MSNKLIKDMDEESWCRFVAFCKLKNINVNTQLKEILDEFLDKNLQNIIVTKKGGKR
jgi:hypothetical protein